MTEQQTQAPTNDLEENLDNSTDTISTIDTIDATNHTNRTINTTNNTIISGNIMTTSLPSSTEIVTHIPHAPQLPHLLPHISHIQPTETINIPRHISLNQPTTTSTTSSSLQQQQQQHHLLINQLSDLEQIPNNVLDDYIIDNATIEQIILIALLSGQTEDEIEEFVEHYRIKLYERLLSMDCSEINEQINKECPICNLQLNPPYVKLYCDCEYHLHCFNRRMHTNQCIKCDDTIYKTRDDEYKVCSICLQPLKNEMQKLFCEHFFHWSCIKTWYLSTQQNNHKCPVCRCNILFM